MFIKGYLQCSELKIGDCRGYGAALVNMVRSKPCGFCNHWVNYAKEPMETSTTTPGLRVAPLTGHKAEMSNDRQCHYGEVVTEGKAPGVKRPTIHNPLGEIKWVLLAKLSAVP